MTEKTETEKSEPTEDFQSIVQGYQDKRKCTRVQALQLAAKSHPELHQEFIKTGGSLDKSIDDEGKSFMELVISHQERNQCSRVAALQTIAHAFPNKHREFIEQANSREGD